MKQSHAVFLLLTVVTPVACHKPPSADASPAMTQQSAATAAAPPTVATAARAPSAAPASPAVTVVAPSASSLCRDLCAASAPLHCRAAGECAQHCQQMIEIPTCQTEMLATLRCFAKQPTSNWECDTDGAPSIKEGVCNPEQEAFTNCMQPH